MSWGLLRENLVSIVIMATFQCQRNLFSGFIILQCSLLRQSDVLACLFLECLQNEAVM